jgi:hypothetical protein
MACSPVMLAVGHFSIPFIQAQDTGAQKSSSGSAAFNHRTLEQTWDRCTDVPRCHRSKKGAAKCYSYCSPARVFGKRPAKARQPPASADAYRKYHLEMKRLHLQT